MNGLSAILDIFMNNVLFASHAMIFARCFAFLVMAGFLKSVPAIVKVAISIAFSIFFAQQHQVFNPGMFDFVMECVIGALMGIFCNLFFSLVSTVGEVIALQIGLSNAFGSGLDHNDGISIGAFVRVAVISTALACNVQDKLVNAFVHSYNLFPPGSIGIFFVGAHWVKLAFGVFNLAVRLSGPFLFVAVFCYVVTAIIARVMQGFPIFFLAHPIQVLVGLVLFYFILPYLATEILTSFGDMLG